MYGLNNNLGSANNTNRTQNNAKSKNKYSIDGLDILNDFKNGKTGGQRLKSVIQSLLGGK